MKNENKKVKLNKTQLLKKTLLLKQKFLTDVNITHNNYQYQIDTLREEQETTRNQLREQIDQLGNALQQTAKKFKRDMEMIGNIGQNKQIREQISSEIIDGQQLKNYLNAEKSVLKQMLQDQTTAIKSSESDKLHNLIRKKQLQQVLEQVKLKELQREVMYLSTHVINSSGIIYIPEDNITQAQENQLKSQLQIQLNQLDRLINLEVVCSAKQSASIQSPTYQEKRLATVFQLLTTEKQAISMMGNNADRFSDISKKFPLFVSKQSQQKINLLDRKKFETVTEQQIQTIITNFDLFQYTETISSHTCIHEQLNNNLKSLRSKIKKFQ